MEQKWHSLPSSKKEISFFSNTEGTQEIRNFCSSLLQNTIKVFSPNNKKNCCWSGVGVVYTMANKDTNTNYQEVVRVADQYKIIKLTIRIPFFFLRLYSLFSVQRVFRSQLKKITPPPPPPPTHPTPTPFTKVVVLFNIKQKTSAQYSWNKNYLRTLCNCSETFQQWIFEIPDNSKYWARNRLPQWFTVKSFRKILSEVVTLHKKSSFTLWISSVSVTKFARNSGFGHIY